MTGNIKCALVLGGGGFIGSHMVRKMKALGYWVRAVDLKFPEFSDTAADDFVQGDLRDGDFCLDIIDRKFDIIFQFAADMGGAGFVFTGENDADIMSNSALINLNVLNAALRRNCRKIFYSSSACMYPEHNQVSKQNPNCREDSAYPANPDSEYGWEKLFSERLYLAYARNYNFNIYIARYHNIFGPEGTWDGGREKSPAAICRKVAMSTNGVIDVWGDGTQTRSYLYIDECIEGTLNLINSGFSGPVNIGSEEMVSINELVEIVSKISGKAIQINHINGPIGVLGRNSNNDLLRARVGWEPKLSLSEGLTHTYKWIVKQIEGK